MGALFLCRSLNKYSCVPLDHKKIIIPVPEDRLRGAPLPKCVLPAVSAMRLPLLGL